MYHIVLILSLLLFVCIAQAIVNVNGGSLQCTGSVIHPRWMITAASCFAYGQIPDNVIVNMGSNNYGVERIAVHPNYIYPDNDIALIRLNANVLNSNDIQRVDFNNDADYRRQALVANFGPIQAVDQNYCGAFTINYSDLICILGQPDQNCQIAAGTPIFYNGRQIGLRTGTYDWGNQAQAFTRISRHTDWLMNQLNNYGDYFLQ